jgi:hypothetical protein
MGAEFMQVYSKAVGTRIKPSDYAVHVEEKEHEKNVSVLPLVIKICSRKGALTYAILNRCLKVNIIFF